MKSQKWVILSIRDKHLRKARKNLRLLLKLALDAELSRLRDVGNLYRHKRIKRPLTPSQWRRETSLSRCSNTLLHKYSRSILHCSECSSPNLASFDKDMVWNPLLKHWICIDCYNVKYSTEAQKEGLRNLLEARNIPHFCDPKL